MPQSCSSPLRSDVPGAVKVGLDLLYVSSQLPWRQTLAGAMVEESGQLVAHSLTLHVVTDGGHAKRQERLHQQHAQPVAHLWEGQGRCPLLPPVRFPDQEPDRDQGQGHVLMPALPGPHLVRIHTCFPLTSLEAAFN